MSLYFVEGFEGIVPDFYSTHTQSAADFVDYYQRRYPHWVGTGSVGGISLLSDQVGTGKAMSWGTAGNGQNNKIFFGTHQFPIIPAGTGGSTWYFGCRVKTQDTANNITYLRWYGEAPADVVVGRLDILSDGSMRLYKGSGTIVATSAPGVVDFPGWHYIEAGLKIGTTVQGGAYEIRVDGVNVMSASGLDTRLADYKGTTRFEMGGTFLFSGRYEDAYLLDDIYIADSSGSFNNNFLGPIRIYGYRPTAEDGTGSWLASDPTKFTYDMVNNLPLDLTKYISTSNVAANLCKFEYPDHPTGGIKGVMHIAGITNTTPQVAVYKLQGNSGASTGNESIDWSDAENAYYEQQMLEVDPDTSALWTEGGLNAATFGVEVG